VNVKLAIAAAVMLTVSHARAEETADSCRQALHYATTTHDLPRTVLWLDRCQADDPNDANVTPAIARRVRKQLEASDLSKLDAVSTPEGLDVSIDAMPELHLQTPATFWVPAGKHELRFVRQRDGKAITRTIDVKPRAHVPVVVSLDEPVAKPPKDGHVSFEEEPEVHDGPPPEAKHPPMLSCKYRGDCPASGIELRDPLEPAVRAPADAVDTKLRLGLRVGGGVSSGLARGGYAIGAIATYAVASRLGAVARVDFAQRLAQMDSLSSFAIAGGVSLRAATARTFAIAIGADARGELRLADALAGQHVDRFGLAGDVVVDVVLRRVPLVVGARLEQGITPLVADQRATAGFLEVAIELR
jgi:hypothetical protein